MAHFTTVEMAEGAIVLTKPVKISKYMDVQFRSLVSSREGADGWSLLNKENGGRREANSPGWRKTI